jgi:hypothetical protein
MNRILLGLHLESVGLSEGVIFHCAVFKEVGSLIEPIRAYHVMETLVGSMLQKVGSNGNHDNQI